ncbi:MAG: XdhC family protein [Dehalococcoidia bacterium]
MKDILPDLDRWQSLGEEIALATVVRVQRSAPRPAGARLIVTRKGLMAGSVTSGCVEADVFERALQVLESGKPVVVNYGIADELGFQVGLSCGGSIDVLIEPFYFGDEWNCLRRAIEGQQPAIYAIALAPSQLLGHKMTMIPQEGCTGSIAPELDGILLNEGGQLAGGGGTKIISLPWEGGEAQVYLEAFPPEPNLVIIGATHTAISLSRMAKEVGLRVTLMDARSALATEERFPDVDQIIRAWPEEGLSGMSLGDHSSVVVLTHDPKFDVPALAGALRSKTRYIGALGSRVTHEQRKSQLRKQGFTDTDFSRIRSPIGLNIGSRTPQELAVAILAEMLAVKYERD